MKKILVIGSTGKVGGALTEALIRAGQSVRAATRSPERFTASDGVEPVRFDYTDTSTYASALDGVDRIFMMEPQPSLDVASDKRMIPFLEEAAKGDRKIVLMSSASVEYDDTEPLRRVEVALERSGSAFVVLRPNWFMDNFHTWWLEPIKEANVIPVPAADARSAFIDSRDVADCAAAVLLSDRFDKKTFTLTGPEALTYEQAAATLSKKSGREIQYVPIDDESFTASLVDVGLPLDTAEYLTGLFRATRRGTAATPSKDVEALTGNKPRTLETYAEDNKLAWQ